ncbi:MAG: AEC family transporter [Anaerolineales bacterium]
MSLWLGLFAENIFPILIVATAGFALQRAIKLDPRPVSQIVFYVLAPALVFNLLYTSQIDGRGMLRMVGLTLLLMAILAVISWAVARALRLPARLASAFILTCTLMNAGNYGLPLSQFAFGEAGLAWASVFFITSAMITNSAGVYIASLGVHSPKNALLGLAKVPAIYAVPLALAVQFAGFTLPLPIMRPIELLSSAAVPCMLLLLGMHTAKTGLPRHGRLIALAAGIRLLASPLFAWLLSPPFQLTIVARQAAIAEAAMPTAVFTTVLASKYDVEPDFVTSVVLATTLLSPLTVTPLIATLGA